MHGYLNNADVFRKDVLHTVRSCHIQIQINYSNELSWILQLRFLKSKL